MNNSLIIAGAHSGAGKTTISLGIMHALHLRGLDVQGFKIGPDYIDTHWQQYATGRVSHNLDEYMLGKSGVRALFQNYSATSDINIIEGVAGLYDGFGLDPSFCSSYGMANILKAPIILVLDGKAAATSVAAVVHGFKTFQPDVPLAGVIVNRVNSEYHYQWIKQAIEQYCQLPVLGRLADTAELRLAERQLGLSQEQIADDYWQQLAETVEQQIDLDQLLQVAQRHASAPTASPLTGDFPKLNKRLAIAKDEAFWFYYQANFDLLEQYGIELVFFSPLHDSTLPACDAIYIGGGFPERFAKQLSSNQAMHQALQQAHQKHIAIYAEGGGVLYLSQSLRLSDQTVFSMVGLIPLASEISNSLQNFGYTEALAEADNLLIPVGETLRGHEFHYGRFIEQAESTAFSHAKIRDGKSLRRWPGGVQIGSCLASFMQIHFWQKPSLISHWFANSRD